MATGDLARLANYVKTRRLERFASRKAAADAAGISKDTWARVEQGLDVRETSYAGVDRALGWATGSCLAISHGGEPVPVDYVESEGGAAVAVRPPSAWAGASAEEVVRKAIADGALIAAPGLQLGQMRELTERIVQTLREEGVLPKSEE